MTKITPKNMREINIECPDYLAKDLDDEQRKAVESPIGNICVNAIAGSGKTRVLTYRVANLIANNFSESQMMLLTFTNKAAGEMIGRIQSLLNKDSLSLLSGTFHSVACKFLRKYSSIIGYPSNFTILDVEDQKSLFQEIRADYLDEHNLEDKKFPAKNVLASIYSGKINHNLTTEEYIIKNNENLIDYLEYINEIFDIYVNRKKSSSFMDFDDLLLNFMMILKNNNVQKEITHAYPMVFVDEYQDINWMQHEILESLNLYQTLFIIGDESQCIYQFRGSNESYIRNFDTTHKNAKRYKLTYNYRSTPEILKIAEDSINHNDVREYINLNAKQKSGKLPEIHEFMTDSEQANEIAKIIKSKYSNNYLDVAILVRASYQVRTIENALRMKGIPYKLVGMLAVFDKEQIKDLIAFLQFKDNYDNEIAFMRICKLFSGIGRKTMKKIYTYLKSINFNFDNIDIKLSAKVKDSFDNLMKLITYEYTSISEWIEYILKEFYIEYANNRFEDSDERLEEISQSFIPYCEKFNDISSVLQDLALFSNDQKENSEEKEYVTIMTMHKAKGLEWDYVFLPGIAKYTFPKMKLDTDYINNVKSVQNERNLFYVAITRARKQLYIMYYNKTFRNANAGPSQFIKFNPNDDNEKCIDLPFDFDIERELSEIDLTWEYEISPEHYQMVNHVSNNFFF